MYKCLKQDDDQYEETNLNNDLLQICNNLGLNSLNVFNRNRNNEQPIALFKDLNNNNNLLTSITSNLNSPVSISSPTASSTNQKQEEDDKDLELFNSNQLSNNQNQATLTDEIVNQTDDELSKQLPVGDEFIIDNRKNINQNRIKSSILGAAKHKKRQVNEVKIQPVIEEDNNSAINLTINSPTSSTTSLPRNNSSSTVIQTNQNKKCVCPLCHNSFTQRNSLNRHIRSHTGKF